MAVIGVPTEIRIPGDMIAAMCLNPSAKSNNPPTVSFFHGNCQPSSDVRLPSKDLYYLLRARAGRSNRGER